MISDSDHSMNEEEEEEEEEVKRRRKKKSKMTITAAKSSARKKKVKREPQLHASKRKPEVYNIYFGSISHWIRTYGKKHGFADWRSARKKANDKDRRMPDDEFEKGKKIWAGTTFGPNLIRFLRTKAGRSWPPYDAFNNPWILEHYSRRAGKTAKGGIKDRQKDVATQFQRNLVPPKNESADPKKRRKISKGNYRRHLAAALGIYMSQNDYDKGFPKKEYLKAFLTKRRKEHEQWLQLQQSAAIADDDGLHYDNDDDNEFGEGMKLQQEDAIAKVDVAMDDNRIQEEATSEIAADCCRRRVKFCITNISIGDEMPPKLDVSTLMKMPLMDEADHNVFVACGKKAEREAKLTELCAKFDIWKEWMDNALQAVAHQQVKRKPAARRPKTMGLKKGNRVSLNDVNADNDDEVVVDEVEIEMEGTDEPEQWESELELSAESESDYHIFGTQPFKNVVDSTGENDEKGEGRGGEGENSQNDNDECPPQSNNAMGGGGQEEDKGGQPFCTDYDDDIREQFGENPPPHSPPYEYMEMMEENFGLLDIGAEETITTTPTIADSCGGGVLLEMKTQAEEGEEEEPPLQMIEAAANVDMMLTTQPEEEEEPPLQTIQQSTTEEHHIITHAIIEHSTTSSVETRNEPAIVTATNDSSSKVAPKFPFKWAVMPPTGSSKTLQQQRTPLKIHQVHYDGNCLLSAFSINMYGHPNQHLQLRKHIFEKRFPSLINELIESTSSIGDTAIVENLVRGVITEYRNDTSSDGKIQRKTVMKNGKRFLDLTLQQAEEYSKNDPAKLLYVYAEERAQDFIYTSDLDCMISALCLDCTIILLQLQTAKAKVKNYFNKNKLMKMIVYHGSTGNISHFDEVDPNDCYFDGDRIFVYDNNVRVGQSQLKIDNPIVLWFDGMDHFDTFRSPWIAKETERHKAAKKAKKAAEKERAAAAKKDKVANAITLSITHEEYHREETEPEAEEEHHLEVPEAEDSTVINQYKSFDENEEAGGEEVRGGGGEQPQQLGDGEQEQQILSSSEPMELDLEGKGQEGSINKEQGQYKEGDISLLDRTQRLVIAYEELTIMNESTVSSSSSTGKDNNNRTTTTRRTKPIIIATAQQQAVAAELPQQSTTTTSSKSAAEEHICVDFEGDLECHVADVLNRKDRIFDKYEVIKLLEPALQQDAKEKIDVILANKSSDSGGGGGNSKEANLALLTDIVRELYKWLGYSQPFMNTNMHKLLSHAQYEDEQMPKGAAISAKTTRKEKEPPAAEAATSTTTIGQLTTSTAGKSLCRKPNSSSKTVCVMTAIDSSNSKAMPKVHSSTNTKKTIMAEFPRQKRIAERQKAAEKAKSERVAAERDKVNAVAVAPKSLYVKRPPLPQPPPTARINSTSQEQQQHQRPQSNRGGDEATTTMTNRAKAAQFPQIIKTSRSVKLHTEIYAADAIARAKASSSTTSTMAAASSVVQHPADLAAAAALKIRFSRGDILFKIQPWNDQFRSGCCIHCDSIVDDPNNDKCINCKLPISHECPRYIAYCIVCNGMIHVRDHDSMHQQCMTDHQKRVYKETQKLQCKKCVKAADNCLTNAAPSSNPTASSITLSLGSLFQELPSSSSSIGGAIIPSSNTAAKSTTTNMDQGAKKGGGGILKNRSTTTNCTVTASSSIMMRKRKDDDDGATNTGVRPKKVSKTAVAVARSATTTTTTSKPSPKQQRHRDTGGLPVLKSYPKK